MAKFLGYPEITPERVAIHSLFECKRHLTEVGPENLYIVSAACSANRALQAALTAGLAGSANIGASPPKIRERWLQWFESDRLGKQTPHPGFRVMSLRELACHAATSAMPWSGHPLEFSALEGFHLMRLSSYRDDFEHPKQLTYILTNREVARSIAITIPIAIRALEEVRHHIYDEIEIARKTCHEITIKCEEIEKIEVH